MKSSISSPIIHISFIQIYILKTNFAIVKFDLRILQILFLASFLSYGIFVLDWETNLVNVSIIILIAALTQSLFCLAFNLPIHALKSALITSLGIAILLRSNHLFIFGMTAFFAIGAKYIFRIQHKHFINPANFGIVFIILFTGKAWISPSQWGSSTALIFIIGSLGLMILTNLKKIDLAISFLIFYFGFDFVWNIIYKGWPLDSFSHNFSNGSTLLFTFFMITDPSSTPNSRLGRILWVMIIAIIAFYLTTFQYVKGAPLYALFVSSILVPIFDQLFLNEMFSWDSIKNRTLYSNSKEAI